MAEKKDIAKEASSLRKRAEEIDREKTSRIPENMKNLSPAETKQVLHELRVHQIELEMQNEELRKAHNELDDSRLRYFELFDLAPVGYCTISEKGLILEANLTAAIILNVPRGSLVKTIFSQFILKEDQDIYYLHRKQLLQSAEPHVFELRMVKKDGTVFWAHLVATVAKDPSINSGQVIDGAQVCRVVMSDISEHKRDEDALKEKVEDLQRFHKLVVGRELTMIELKKEVNALLKKSGQEEKYRIVE
ncbi:MAG: PAS domain-containing protein [Lentisphaerae bacterium]|nr:PAS domain-containing protein [Lentisphaerota bacterium]